MVRKNKGRCSISWRIQLCLKAIHKTNIKAEAKFKFKFVFFPITNKTITIKSVSIETSISHIKPCKEGDTITAVTKEISLSNKIAIYNIDIFNQQNVLVSAFKGTVYRTGKTWFEE